MIENLTIGLVVILVCLVIQCLFVCLAAHILLLLDRRGFIQPTLWRGTSVLTLTLMFLFLGNLAQMSLWASLFVGLDEFAHFKTAFYHSAVNFTTIGYGDVVMSESRRLLGALEGANGVLMFGLTTSVIFIVMSHLLTHAWRERKDHSASQQESEPS